MFDFIRHLIYSNKFYIKFQMSREKKKLTEDMSYCSSLDFFEYDRNAPDAFLPDGKTANQLRRS